MPNLQHPETGEQVRASRATADLLIEEGWHELTSTASTEEATEPEQGEPSRQTPPPPEPSPAATAIPEPEKPLDKMKLPELITYAEKIGVPAEQLDALRKPGASKAKAIEAINGHVSGSAA